MTREEEELRAALTRKQEIDELEAGKFVETHRWLVEAVELLLKIEIEREVRTRRTPSRSSEHHLSRG